MPKRICPFDCDLIPQTKIHISEKEAYHGDNMKSVYDKTLKMLFNGAKRAFSTDDSQITSSDVQSSVVLKQNYKQMFLGNHCQLKSNGIIKPEPQLHCERCSLRKTDVQGRCTFCEKILCVQCIVACAKCGEEFCKPCTLVTYSDLEDEHRCLGCCR
ncbi:apoptosis regulatory protein Siva [Periplaneta americana]|uniref:apoptosis regulatory protein Siva n=1 Tax=Periplaneta americana TaxID=6978 RepID=UPI0037E8E5FA